MQSLTFFCVVLIISLANGQGYFAPAEEEQIVLSPFARTRFVRQGYGSSAPEVETVPYIVDQKPLQPIESLPNYGGGGGIEQGGFKQPLNAPLGGQSGGYGGSGSGGFGGQSGSFGGKQTGGFGGQTGGFGGQTGGLGGQSGGYGGSSSLGKAPVSYGNPLNNPRPHHQGHRQQNSYGGGNGGAPITFGGSGSYGSSQGGRPGGNFNKPSGSGYGQPQPVNQGYGGGGSIGGGSHGFDSYSQPPVIPQGGGYGPALVVPPQKAPVSSGGYGR